MKYLIEFKGKKIHFQVSGKGPAVVLLHGFLESGAIWKNFARRMAGSYTVVVIDLPGHGDSECLGPVNSMDEMAEAVNQVLRSLKIGKCLMVGHSMGGYVTLMSQALLPAHSEVLLLDHVGHMGFIEAAGKTFDMMKGFAGRLLK